MGSTSPPPTLPKRGIATTPSTPGTSIPSTPARRSAGPVKVVDAEVGPNSFQKIKLIGKGDVGKVYLVVRNAKTRFKRSIGVYTDNLNMV